MRGSDREHDGEEGRSTHSVKGNSQRTALLGLFGLTRVVDNGLMVLCGVSRAARDLSRTLTTHLIRTVGKVHANNIETSCNPISPACDQCLSIEHIIPLRSALIFSVWLVLGPERRHCTLAPVLGRKFPGRTRPHPARKKKTYQWCQ